MPPQDPDEATVATFRDHTIPNVAKTSKEGRPMFDDVEVCEIRFAGSRNVSVFPATAISFWRQDPVTGESIPVTYAERFRHQYEQFKMKSTQTKAGTPIAYLPTITEARRAELRALNIYTVEALADVDGQPLKNLGPGGRELKNKAIEYIESSKQNVAPNLAMEEELNILRAQNAVLKEDSERLKQITQDKGDTPDPDEIFDGMTLDQLREYITKTSGMPPHGSLNRKTLIRMCHDARQHEHEAA